MTRSWVVVVAAVAVVAAAAAPVAAGVERYAVLIASNRGLADEAELRYAEADVGKVEGVLRDLGGIPAENITVLRGADPAAVRRALIAVNDRVRTAGGDSLLFVYYSGHASADGLHLGRAILAHDEVTKLVRGSAATIRLLVVDSCRSGAVTRRKGGRAVAAFAIAVEESLAGEGAIFLSSSAADEDSQESDDLKGSFFTHYLVSGLVGAADIDGDGQVVIDEAYRYAYDNTLRASSRTEAGAQHPTFRYDVRGQGKIALSWPAATVGTRGQLTVPVGRAYLVFERDGQGAVAAEVSQHDTHRTIALRPGRYFVRGRGDDDLLEGAVTIAAGQVTTVDAGALDRVAYARLVRKGGPRRVARALTVEAVARSGLYGGVAPCLGGAVAHRLDLPALTLQGRVTGCRAGYRNSIVATTAIEVGGEAAALHVRDFRSWAVEFGVVAGASWLHQRHQTRGVAPPRDALAPLLGVDLAAAIDLEPRLYLSLTVRARTYFMQRTSGAGGEAVALIPVFTGGVGVGLGWRY